MVFSFGVCVKYFEKKKRENKWTNRARVIVKKKMRKSEKGCGFKA